MIVFKRTASDHNDFRELVKLLDADLAIRDGKDHSFFAQFNKLDSIKHVVIAYFDNVPAGCGAIKHYDADTMEVKRMFVKPEYRRKGIAKGVLNDLEKWTADLGYSYCILETGKKQPEAISLYKTSGYELIANYGQYEKVENSVCFRKGIRHQVP